MREGNLYEPQESAMVDAFPLWIQTEANEGEVPFLTLDALDQAHAIVLEAAQALRRGIELNERRALLVVPEHVVGHISALLGGQFGVQICSRGGLDDEAWAGERAAAAYSM